MKTFRKFEVGGLSKSKTERWQGLTYLLPFIILGNKDEIQSVVLCDVRPGPQKQICDVQNQSC